MSEKRLITAEDLKLIRTLGQPALSPDGRWVVYQRSDADSDGRGYVRNLWIASTDGAVKPRLLTRSGKDSSPVWSPDGRTLAFISARSGKGQVYTLAMDGIGGEPRQVTDMPNGVTTFVYSPEGTQIAFTAPMIAEDRAKEDDPEAKIEAVTADDPRVVYKVPYRVGTSYLNGKFAQVYVMALPVDDDDKSKPRRLTSENEDYTLPRWSADGKAIYVARAYDPTADEPFRQSRVFKINVETGELVRVTDDSHVSGSPIPSPDGRWLAFLRFPHENASNTITRLAVMNLASGEVRDVNLALDRSPASAVNVLWSGSLLMFSAQGEGKAAIYAYDPDADTLRALIEGEFKSELFDARPDGLVAYVASTSQTPQELYLWQDGESRPITRIHETFLQDVRVTPFHALNFEADDGTLIQGWYLLPPDAEAGKQYPLIVNIHGGPHIMWGSHDENMWHEMQTFAARGYVVFFCNPRGSGGYGEAFQLALKGVWGSMAMGDIMRGVELLVNTGVVDTSRMYVTGGSYGGYMTAWIAAHTDRFKAAVAVRGVYNLLSFFGTSDIPSFVRDEMSYTPFENPQFLWENSPLAHAHKIKIPTLIIHSENDFRVPISEGEQFFGYLRRAGVETEFVRYPREGHELTRAGEPQHRIDHMQRVVDWFDKHGGKQ